MLTRTSGKTWTFRKPFVLKGVDRELPAGRYRVTSDEELIEGLSFPAYRRVAKMIVAPRCHSNTSEMLVIDPEDLEAALERDAAAAKALR